MSIDDNPDDDYGRDFEDHDSQRVLDEEGDVDAAVKQRIFDSRRSVDENHNELFTKRHLNPENDLSDQWAVVAFGHTVRRFLQNIEPLLRNDDVPENREYYNQIELGEVVLYPPDKAGYQFSRVADVEDDKRAKQMLNLPPQVEVPRPHTETFEGLKDIIESGDVVTASWRVNTNPVGAPSTDDILELVAQRPIGREIYEKAVREADWFLDQAGLGVKTGTPEVDVESEVF